MAVFKYTESEKYFNLVKLDIEAGKKVKLGVNGEEEVLFDETQFRPIADKVGQDLLTALKKKNNTYFTSTVGGVYRFTQIFKGTYSGQVKKISTKQQEQISLKIMEEIYSSNTKKYESFSEMFDVNGSKIKKLFPDLRSNNEWWNHFTLQFNEIDNIKELKNSSYDVYEYDGFMEYITDFVTKTNKWYTSKDSWNPADIWLIEKSKLDRYTKSIDKSKTIQRVNRILRVAAGRKHIVGISLKKSDGKKLNFEWVNLTFKEQELPNVKFSELRFKTDYDTTTNTFQSKTSTFRVKEGINEFELSFRSNQSSLQNITYEFKKIGGAAQLGKVPKNEMTKWLNDQLHLKLPVATDLKKTFQGNERYWKHVVDTVNSQKRDLNFKYPFDINKVLENIKASYSANGLSIKNGIFLQMLEFVYILADYNKKSRNDLDEFATLCFYFAQKKGKKYGFGPFGKLY